MPQIGRDGARGTLRAPRQVQRRAAPVGSPLARQRRIGRQGGPHLWRTRHHRLPFGWTGGTRGFTRLNRLTVPLIPQIPKITFTEKTNPRPTLRCVLEATTRSGRKYRVDAADGDGWGEGFTL